MGKFVLSEIKSKIQEKALAVKTAAQFQLAGGMGLVMDKMFGFYKIGLLGYASGKPSATDKWLVKLVVIPAIDRKYNQASIDKLSLIVNKELPNEDDVKFIKDEVIPYFNDNCKRLTGKELELIGFPSNDELGVFKEKIDKQVKRGKKIDSKISKSIVEDMTGATKIR